MLAYFNAVFSGEADPFWPHLILLSLSVSAGIAVGVGIIFEAPEYSAAIHRVAKWLVIAGVAIESVCTVSLFVFDEDISTAQQSKIIALRAHAVLVSDALLANVQAVRAHAVVAGLNRTTMELEAIRHGWIDPKYLSEAARSFGIVPKIKSFAGTQFDALAISDNIELEVFLRSLTSGLKAAYWIEAEATNTPKAIDGGATALVTIRVYAGKVSKLWAAAEALASALKDDGIEALPEEMPIPENSNANTIHILIGPKGR